MQFARASPSGYGSHELSEGSDELTDTRIELGAHEAPSLWGPTGQDIGSYGDRYAAGRDAIMQDALFGNNGASGSLGFNFFGTGQPGTIQGGSYQGSYHSNQGGQPGSGAQLLNQGMYSHQALPAAGALHLGGMSAGHGHDGGLQEWGLSTLTNHHFSPHGWSLLPSTVIFTPKQGQQGQLPRLEEISVGQHPEPSQRSSEERRRSNSASLLPRYSTRGSARQRSPSPSHGRRTTLAQAAEDMQHCQSHSGAPAADNPDELARLRTAPGSSRQQDILEPKRPVSPGSPDYSPSAERPTQGKKDLPPAKKVAPRVPASKPRTNPPSPPSALSTRRSARTTTRARSPEHAASPGASERRSKASTRTSLQSGRNKSSRYRGVTKHRRSGRWEAHLWVKELHRQVYLGGYEEEQHAAEAYDVAALKSKGLNVKTNFEISRYADLTACMHSISLEELIMAVRRQSQGFSRGSSTYRGVTHHPSGRWEARIGIPGSKHIYLGLWDEEEGAARAYDGALVRLRGAIAATNFSLSDYRAELADYHKKQQEMLQANQDPDLCAGEAFEEWIKSGSSGDGTAKTINDAAGAAAAAEPRRSARAAAMRESGQVLELPWKLDAEAEAAGEE